MDQLMAGWSPQRTDPQRPAGIYGSSIARGRSGSVPLTRFPQSEPRPHRQSSGPLSKIHQDGTASAPAPPLPVGLTEPGRFRWTEARGQSVPGEQRPTETGGPRTTNRKYQKVSAGRWGALWRRGEGRRKGAGRLERL
ncbi:hypothetical protein GOODEAATRI_032851 [Goodea atripinnis]|uniref:Uncharacterized protein n=1 Tax=Goodea atripinnis TaxID=208336 RepID=A0ABV0NFN9_9TELE